MLFGHHRPAKKVESSGKCSANTVGMTPPYQPLVQDEIGQRLPERPSGHAVRQKTVKGRKMLIGNMANAFILATR